MITKEFAKQITSDICDIIFERNKKLFADKENFLLISTSEIMFEGKYLFSIACVHIDKDKIISDINLEVLPDTFAEMYGDIMDSLVAEARLKLNTDLSIFRDFPARRLYQELERSLSIGGGIM